MTFVFGRTDTPSATSRLLFCFLFCFVCVDGGRWLAFIFQIPNSIILVALAPQLIQLSCLSQNWTC